MHSFLLSMTQEILNLSETVTQLNTFFCSARGGFVWFSFVFHNQLFVCRRCQAQESHKRAENTCRDWIRSAWQVSLWKCASLGVFRRGLSRWQQREARPAGGQQDTALGRSLPAPEHLLNLGIFQALSYILLAAYSFYFPVFQRQHCDSPG